MSAGGLPGRSGRWWICVFLLILCFNARAAAPGPDFFHPPGAAVDSTNLVRVTGKFDPWPPKVWVDSPGVSFLARTNQGEFQVTVKAGALPGPRLVRFFNEEGASEPKPFVIGIGPEVVEVEPNDLFSRPQRIETLPVTVNGRLEKAGDVDCFSVTLKAGQVIEAAVDSFVLMSRLDAVLRLVATNGMQLAWNNDFATIDPRLTWHATTDQTVVVQLFGFPYPATSDVRLTGGDGAIYRLHLGLVPQGVPWTNKVDTTVSPPALVELPFSTTNWIHTPGELHRVRLRVAEPGWVAANVRAESIGSPLDAWLRLDDAKGKEISRNDDHDGSRDPYLEWLAATNTEYTIVVGSLTRLAGEDQRFELSLRRVEPDYVASAGASSLTLKPGTTNELPVTFTRLRGFTNEVRVAVTNLPSGITVEPVAAPAKDGEVKLLFVARTNAPAFQGPFEIEARDVTSGKSRTIPFLMTGGTVNNGVPGGYRVLLADRIRELWMTVLAPEPPKSAAKEAKAEKISK